LREIASAGVPADSRTIVCTQNIAVILDICAMPSIGYACFPDASSGKFRVFVHFLANISNIFEMVEDPTEDSNLTHRAYSRLRSDLIACRLLPESRLNIAKLQKELGFSQAAVREALSRLTAEGLVTIERNAGFRAAPISRNGFRDLTSACANVEIPCLRSALANGDLMWEGALLATYHVASKVLERVVAGQEDISAYAIHRQSFHETLLSPCSNQWMLWSWRLLYTQHMRYRHTFKALSFFELDLKSDFDRFMHHVLAHDVQAAVQACLENYEKVAEFIDGSALSEAPPLVATQ
jgi:GntR family carbon starvation induced transcriptional regulator